MANSDQITASNIDTTQLLLIVVGAHLRAEVADRPLAYWISGRIEDWLEKYQDELNSPFLPVVCSDVWYVNHEQLQQRPTICIGGPGVNALSSYFRKDLATALILEDKLIIQLDPEFVDLRVCIWGMNHTLTHEAVETFTTKYLDQYLRAGATQVEPHDEHDS